MEARTKIKAALFNKISNARADVLLDTSRTIETNIRFWQLKNPELNSFLSPQDRSLIEKDLPDGSFPGIIEFGIWDKEGNAHSLDARKVFADAWNEAFKEEPVPEMQEFYLLVNGYYAPEDTAKNRRITGTVSEVVTLSIENYTELIKDQAELGSLREINSGLKKDLTKALVWKDQFEASEEASKKKLDIIYELKAQIKKQRFLAFKIFLLALAIGAVCTFICSLVLFKPFSQNAVSSEEYQTLAEELEKEKNRNEQLTGENEGYMKTNEDLTSENEELKKEIRNIEKTLEEKEAEIEKLNNQLKESQKTVNPSDETADTADDADALKMDPLPLGDLREYAELVKEGDASGKTVTFNNYAVYDYGIIFKTVWLGSDNYIAMFNLVVPKGYTSLSFDIGHLMDTTLHNVGIHIEIDGTKYELENNIVKFNQSPQHIEVKGLKENQLVSFAFRVENDVWTSKDYTYGIVNLKFHKK